MGEMEKRELSFWRARHEVDLVERAVESDDPVVICVAKSVSKIFISVKVVEEASRRNLQRKWIIFVVQEEKVADAFIDALEVNSNLDVIKNWNSDECPDDFSLLPGANGKPVVLVISFQSFQSLVSQDQFSLGDVALVLIHDCHPSIVALNSLSRILQDDESLLHCSTPRFVGLTENLLKYQACPTEMDNFLEEIKEKFACKVLVSSDLFAVNRFGEQALEHKLYCPQQLGTDKLSLQLDRVLHSSLIFLQDFHYSEEETDCVKFLKYLFKGCYQMLLNLGPWSASQTAAVITKEVVKFEKKVSGTTNELLLQFCRTQAKQIQTLVEESGSSSANVNATEFTEGLFQVLVDQKVTKLQNSISVDSNSDFLEQKNGDCVECKLSCSDDQRQRENKARISYTEEYLLQNNEQSGILSHGCEMFENLSLNSGVVGQDLVLNSDLRERKTDERTENKHQVATQCPQVQDSKCKTDSNQGYPGGPPLSQVNDTNNRIPRNDPFCVIMVETAIMAQAVNSLINEIAQTDPEFSFLSSKFISGSQFKKMKESKDVDGSQQEEVTRNILEENINVLVATYDVEDELYISRCNLLVRFDAPKSYESFIRTKSLVRSANSRFIAVLGKGKTRRSDKQYEVYHTIENLLAQYCTKCLPPAQLVYPGLLESSSHLMYKPNSGAGQPVDVDPLSSIHFINRYCSKFPSDGLSSPVPRCRTLEERSEWGIKFTSMLYMPRNCPLSKPFKGEAVVKDEEATRAAIARAKLHSQMVAACHACQALYEANELHENLEPIWKLLFPEVTEQETGVEFVVADGGLGRDGSVKRKRAYKRKFPSVLSDNLPLAKKVCHVYSLEMVLTKPLAHERAIRSQFKSGNKLQLGLVSRNILPKLPDFLVFDRAGEVTVTVKRRGSVVVNGQQLQLMRQFHAYVFTHILDLGSNDSLEFEPESQPFGFYVTLLVNNQTEEGGREKDGDSEGTQMLKQIAFETLHEMENTLGSFQKPQNQSFGDSNDFERFRDAVVTTEHTKEKRRYYVADIRYDMTPLDEFPDAKVAATFQDYFHDRYGIPVAPTQPLLDVDHVSVRLNFLSPRYQNQKGRDLALPQEASKRSRKCKVHLIPETCSIYPIPAHLWRRITLLPSVLYQVDALLLAEEVRAKLSREIGEGVNQWPEDVPIPLLASGETVGEDYVEQTQGNHERIVTREMYNGIKVTEKCKIKGSVEKKNHYKIEECNAKGGIGFTLEARGADSKSQDIQSGSCLAPSSTLTFEPDPMGPSSTLVLRALTAGGAGAMFSYERLEMFGDSFTKFAVSASLFFQYKHANEGKLSFLRGHRVSNRQLFYCGNRRQIPGYMFVNVFQPLVTWKPPGFSVKINEGIFKDGRNLLLGNQSSEEDLLDDEDGQSFEVQQTPRNNCCASTSEVLLHPSCHVCTSDKSIADATEALIGAYLITCGEEGALRFMKWLEMDVELPEEMRNSKDNYIADCNPGMTVRSGYPPQRGARGAYPLQRGAAEEASVELDHLQTEFRTLEDAIHYSFTDKHLLLQAVTHTSYPRYYNTVDTSYENLEFLGDALLDYLVTRHLYFHHRHLDPHLLTDVRSAIVNNYSLAALAVKLGLHRHLRALSPQLFEIVNKFVKQLNSREQRQQPVNPDHVYSSAFVVSSAADGSDCHNIEVPKTLGDLFEALVGAVYVDSGLQVERVWQVLFPLLANSIDHYSAHPPLSPVRQLMEKKPNAVRFSAPERMVDGRFKCSVKVCGVKRSFLGIGRNYKIAKSTAAQQALKHLKSNLS